MITAEQPVSRDSLSCRPGRAPRPTSPTVATKGEATVALDYLHPDGRPPGARCGVDGGQQPRQLRAMVVQRRAKDADGNHCHRHVNEGDISPATTSCACDYTHKRNFQASA
jgi:hypothetical protein